MKVAPSSRRYRMSVLQEKSARTVGIPADPSATRSLARRACKTIQRAQCHSRQPGHCGQAVAVEQDENSCHEIESRSDNRTPVGDRRPCPFTARRPFRSIGIRLLRRIEIHLGPPFPTVAATDCGGLARGLLRERLCRSGTRRKSNARASRNPGDSLDPDHLRPGHPTPHPIHLPLRLRFARTKTRRIEIPCRQRRYTGADRAVVIGSDPPPAIRVDTPS